MPKINPDEVIEGIWEDSSNKSKNVVEKSQLESVENLIFYNWGGCIKYSCPKIFGGIKNR